MKKKPKTSRKTIRPKRSDHPVVFRVSTEELERLKAHCSELQLLAGIEITLGKYAKHATLEHHDLRRKDAELRKLLANEAVNSYFAAEYPGEGPDAGHAFYDSVKAIMGVQ